MEWIVTLTPEAASGDPIAAVACPPKGAAIVELRLDLFPDLDPGAIINACPLPVLATYRSTDEGGRGSGDPQQRRSVLARARDAGAALIDLEHRRDGDLINDLGLAPEQVVLSWHATDGTPAYMEDEAATMLDSRARWVKVVPTATKLLHLRRVLELFGMEAEPKSARRRLISFAMGEVGVPSRLLAPHLGAPVGFAAWSTTAAAAPGQLPIHVVRAVGDHLHGPPQTLFGVLGRNVARSLSPAMHGAGYRAADLPNLFLPISVPDPEDLDQLLCPPGDGLFAGLGLPVGGWAVTTPYKTHAAQAATVRAPRVERAGAANTLLFKGDRILAENTDADGVVGSLKSLGLDPCGLTALIQGSGGAARGAAVGLHLAGARVVLRGRDLARSRAVAEQLGVDWATPDEAPDDVEILVNASPLGSDRDDPLPFARSEIEAARAAVDMVYADHVTELVRRATEAGAAVADGRDILAHQGYAQFAAMTGRLPPRAEMRSALGEAAGPT